MYKTDLTDKLMDAAVPGARVVVTPEEADVLGAFQEDAVSDEEAFAASADLLELKDAKDD